MIIRRVPPFEVIMRVLIAALVGCSSGEPAPSGAGEVVRIESDAYTLAPGDERTRCWYHNLENDLPFDVVRFQTSQRRGQHHFNVFVSDLEKENGYGPCPTNEELFVGARPIVDGSSSAVEYAFPEHMAFRLEPNALLIFQLHSINTTAEPAEQQFSLDLHLSEEPARTLVDIYGFTNFAIDIPPHSTKVETKDCVLYDSVGLLSMSSHFHERGTLATADYIGQDGIVRLYENVSWDDPKVVYFEETVRIAPGDTIRFACHYENKSGDPIAYGPSVQDEMCFVFGYYFPKVGLIPCF